MLAGQGFLQRAVLPGDLAVGPQEIADSQMAFDIGSVRFLKDMDLVRPLVAAFAQVAPAGHAEFA